MRKFFKRATSGLVALSFAAINFTVNIPTAQAFDLGDIIGNIGEIFTPVKNVNVQEIHDKMIENFNYSIALLDASYKNILTATDDSIAIKNIITIEQAAKSALKTNDAGTNMRNGAIQNKQKAEAVKKYLSDAITSGDEEKLKQIDEVINLANRQRMVSDTMAGVAGVQAGKIIAVSVKNMLAGKNFSEVQNIISIAQEIDSLLKVRSELSNILNTATQEYRKTRSIKDPDKEEQKAAIEAIKKG